MKNQSVRVKHGIEKGLVVPVKYGTLKVFAYMEMMHAGSIDVEWMTHRIYVNEEKEKVNQERGEGTRA